MKTLMVMAGGTGGHIFPGIAVAEELRARGWRIVWMGNPEGMEARIVPSRGYDTAWVRFGALRGKGLLRKLLLPVNLLSGFWQALREIRRARPDVVLGMGGYITFPGGMMAALLGRPLVLHEQNSVAGLANRVLARVADRVLSGFPEVLEKAEWMGNPVRAEIAAVLPPAERMAGRSGPLRVLVVGGSLGAAVLNETVPQALLRLPAEQRPTGGAPGWRAPDRGLACGLRARAGRGRAARLHRRHGGGLCRRRPGDLPRRRAHRGRARRGRGGQPAGALPHAVDDHQTGNARFLADRGGAYLLPQSELTPDRLAGILSSLDRGRLLQMAENARALAKPLAAVAVAHVCAELGGGEQA
jgi:UDP-N-acetylglucosamine--N-acetylmuramyl-(pentapeptide) pyrophosphoryl-undecaprenol N-acetylglucosamine transferase